MQRLVRHGRIRRDFFLLAIGVLVTVLLWVGFETYRAFTKSEVSVEVKKQVVPLTPELDLDTMREIKSRHQIPEAAWETIDEKAQIKLEPISQEKRLASPVPEATNSSEL